MLMYTGSFRTRVRIIKYVPDLMKLIIDNEIRG